MCDLTCGFAGCGRPIKSSGLCGTHYLQQWRGQELTPITPRKPKGQGQGYTPGVQAEVRAWAREQGYDVPQRGKIPWQIMEDWRNAKESP